MTELNYSTIENGAVCARDSICPESRNDITESKVFVGKRKDQFVIGGLMAIAFVVACSFVGMRHRKDSVTTMDISASLLFEKSKSSNTLSPCTFKECISASCDPATAPYTCVIHNGGPHGGCSTIPWTVDTCDHQCDLSDCKDVPVPEDAASCKDVDCGEEWCSATNAKLCPHVAPYQCLAGSAALGCVADKDWWAYKTPFTTCSKCCDATACD